MVYYDGHVHIMDYNRETQPFYDRMDQTGVSGGIILSLPPSSFGSNKESFTAEQRLDDLFRYTSGHGTLFPFFWIDPLEKNASAQVDLAIERGVLGFKVICNHFYPGDPQAINIFSKIARSGKPILFHSGILWDGTASSKYNRPVEFEDLINVEGLRFSLAHISWPWCDEHIALYGKILATRNRGVEMFIDTTPGTPPIYRKEALEGLYTVGYDVKNNIFFGSDSLTDKENVSWIKEWIDRDKTILEGLNIGIESLSQYFSENLKRFVGDSSETVLLSPLEQGK